MTSVPYTFHPGTVRRSRSQRPGCLKLVLDCSLSVPANGHVIIPLGVRLWVPRGHAVLVVGRAEVPHIGFHVGVVDSGFRGEVSLVAWNPNTFGLEFAPGMISAALLLVRCTVPQELPPGCPVLPPAYVDDAGLDMLLPTDTRFEALSTTRVRVRNLLPQEHGYTPFVFGRSGLAMARGLTVSPQWFPTRANAVWMTNYSTSPALLTEGTRFAQVVYIACSNLAARGPRPFSVRVSQDLTVYPTRYPFELRQSRDAADGGSGASGDDAEESAESDASGDQRGARGFGSSGLD